MTFFFARTRHASQSRETLQRPRRRQPERLAVRIGSAIAIIATALLAHDATPAQAATYKCPAAATTAGAKRTGPAATKVLIATTVAPITSIVANIVGDRATVEGVVPEGTNSHTFEPKPSVAKLLSKADLVFINGLKLEDPTKSLAQKNKSKTAQIIELGTLTLPPDQYLYDFSFPKEGGKPNPHLWTNPPMAMCYARIVASVTANLDPKNASYYKANAEKYVAKLKKLDEAMRVTTKTIPVNQRRLLTYHDAYAYFAKDYGWSVVGAIQPSSFSEPSPKEVARLITQIKKEKVRAIFGSEVFPSPVLKQIAKESGATYVDKLRDDDLPGAPGDADHSFLGLMKFDYVTMMGALGGDTKSLVAFDPTDVVTDKAKYPQ
jgi:ABC-type Zn uptake system ZnuABC Zn-binding protein ZnuA